MLSYLWILLLIAFFENQLAANAMRTAVPLLLPSEIESFPRATRCPPQRGEESWLNYRPVIGILSHPGDGASGRLNNATNASYIAASYVKFVESAGARIIPLVYNEPSDILYNKLNLVDGVLFTGGWAKSGLYFEVTESIFKNVLRKNDAGDNFPLLAICLGFELVSMIVSEDNNILEEFNAQNQASTLQFMKDLNLNGTVFQRFGFMCIKNCCSSNTLVGCSPDNLFPWLPFNFFLLSFSIILIVVVVRLVHRSAI